MAIGLLKEMPVVLPPLDEQRRIAGILTAYDDLIENCQRRIRILEEMARRLYREWFVHFRYPGHESIPLVDSPLGHIPQGWEVVKLSDLVTTQYGYTESASKEKIGPKYLRGMDINKTSYIEWDEVPYCRIDEAEVARYLLRTNDVLVIRMADPGKVGIIEQDVEAIFASYLIRVRPVDGRLPPYFLFHTVDSEGYQSFVTGASTGTTRKSASASILTEYPFALPPTRILASFEAEVARLRSLLTVLVTKTGNLRCTRDLLLPRLLGGVPLKDST